MSVMNSISSLLLDPNPADALESNIAAEMNHEKELFKEKCLKHVLDHANKPIEEILREILGNDILPTDEFYKKTEKDLTDWIKLNKKS